MRISNIIAILTYAILSPSSFIFHELYETTCTIHGDVYRTGETYLETCTSKKHLQFLGSLQYCSSADTQVVLHLGSSLPQLTWAPTQRLLSEKGPEQAAYCQEGMQVPPHSFKQPCLLCFQLMLPLQGSVLIFLLDHRLLNWFNLFKRNRNLREFIINTKTWMTPAAYGPYPHSTAALQKTLTDDGHWHLSQFPVFHAFK